MGCLPAAGHHCREGRCTDQLITPGGGASFKDQGGAKWSCHSQSALLNVSTPTVDNVANPNSVALKALDILGSDTSDAVLVDLIVPDVRGHDRGNTVCHVVGGVQLTPERSGLDATS